MTRRQTRRERIAYNRLRRLWPEALKTCRWPLSWDARYEATEAMDLPFRIRWRHV